MEEQALLEAIRSDYRRLDRLLGISPEQIPLSFSSRMVRQYGVCCFRADRPTAIRLAAFLKDAPEQLRQTALHEYAHAAAALLTGRRHGHDAVWKSVCLRVGCRPERLSKPCAAAQERAAAYEKSRAGGPVYLVRCLGCGTESPYRRRGKIQLVCPKCGKATRVGHTEKDGKKVRVCKKCGGRSFSLIVEEGLR